MILTWVKEVISLPSPHINTIKIHDMTNQTETSLFERIGGMNALDAAVDIFYQKVLSDDRIKHFFDHTDMKIMRAKQKTFLAYAFGAPLKYEGKDMRAAHAHLVDKYGLNEDHFNAVAGHLSDTLKELSVPTQLIDEVMTIAESTRNDVLGK